MLYEQPYPVTLEARSGRVPVVVVPPSDELDAPSLHLPSEGRRRSGASAVQDWLNASDAALWGLCSNGVQLRLLRANASLTRPAFIQADLRRIFEAEAFADFAVLWLLVHASRFGTPGTAPTDCSLEHWREAGGKEGIAARKRLGKGVEAALLSLGGGFLSHPDNLALRERLDSGALPLSEFFGQLLRLVYRLIFLLAAEDRDLLHPPSASAATRKLYAEGYSVGALRDRAFRRAAWDRHHDAWEGLLIVFAALARGERRLGLPALGGIFEPRTIPDLDSGRLANRNLMEAIYRLAWLREETGVMPVNWRDMETEELGSVYEGLLELTPLRTADGRGFVFAEAGEAEGNARKATASYYTPDSLVQALLDSALDPVLDRVEAEAEEPAAALVEVSVVDPACGSGHFLLAAARRIATRVARHRVSGVVSAEDYRRALRDVVRACIHGVDRNPLAVELTKVALWIRRSIRASRSAFLTPTSAAATHCWGYPILTRCGGVFLRLLTSLSAVTTRTRLSISGSATRTNARAKAISTSRTTAVDRLRKGRSRRRPARCVRCPRTTPRTLPPGASASRPDEWSPACGGYKSLPTFTPPRSWCRRLAGCRRTATRWRSRRRRMSGRRSPGALSTGRSPDGRRTSRARRALSTGRSNSPT
jgi:hypothetical protein